MIGRVPDLNDVERVNIKLVPLPLIMLLFNNATRRFGGGDGGGNGALERSALPYNRIKKCILFKFLLLLTLRPQNSSRTTKIFG
jgi:hypothetical protein